MTATLMCAVILAGPQRRDETRPYEEAAAVRLRTLSARLNSKTIDAGEQRPGPATARITREIHGVVDDFVRDAMSPDGPESVEARIRTLLVNHRPDPEFGDLALAREANVAAGQALILAYTIVRPPHFDVGTIRGYGLRNGRFELVATTGDDFADYNMFKAALPSQRAGEFWLLVWGSEHTFNGRRDRFRVYAFDGTAFETIWAPEDMFETHVTLTRTGFSIAHHLREPPYELNDEYALTVDGVIKIR
jgi:hypothetical protein